MSNTLILNQGRSDVGLQTSVFTIPATGTYSVIMELLVPYDSPGSDSNNSTTQTGSSVTVVVKQNGSTKYTTPTLTPTQGAQQFRTSLQCTAADAIEIDVTSSANAGDQLLNVVKSTIAIQQGV